MLPLVFLHQDFAWSWRRTIYPWNGVCISSQQMNNPIIFWWVIVNIKKSYFSQIFSLLIQFVKIVSVILLILILFLFAADVKLNDAGHIGSGLLFYRRIKTDVQTSYNGSYYHSKSLPFKFSLKFMVLSLKLPCFFISTGLAAKDFEGGRVSPSSLTL